MIYATPGPWLCVLKLNKSTYSCLHSLFCLHFPPGPTSGTVTGRPASMGVVRSLGDSYYMSADVSQFEPHDIVLMAYNHNIVIHAEKVLEDGSVSDTFTHKTLLPEDMDPLSVSSTLTPEGMLVVSVMRIPTMGVMEPPTPPAYRSEAHLGPPHL
uniref:SHSP domain-containing protein n=1 Tax=Salmo trutta TaxID=8032 RepID=A0A674E5P5_SALTR